MQLSDHTVNKRNLKKIEDWLFAVIAFKNIEGTLVFFQKEAKNKVLFVTSTDVCWLVKIDLGKDDFHISIFKKLAKGDYLWYYFFKESNLQTFIKEGKKNGRKPSISVTKKSRNTPTNSNSKKRTRRKT